MKILSFLFLVFSACISIPYTYAQTVVVGPNSLTVCATTPPSTGVYKSQCLGSDKSVYTCANSAGCTVSGDWGSGGSGGGGSIANASLGTGAASISRTATAGVGGVTEKYIAAKDTSTPTRRVLPASGGCGAGIAATTATVGNSFELYVVPGTVILGVADNAITAGHILIGGTDTPGRVRDSGFTSRKSVASDVCVVGVALQGVTSGSDVLFEYDGPGSFGASSSLPAASQIRTWSVAIGGTGSGDPVLADDNDKPYVITNKTGAPITLTSVGCRADAGSPTVTPIITGGSSTSILTGALTCTAGSFAAGTLNGTVTLANNSSIDVNITTAGGTAKYLVVLITVTL